MDRDGMNLRVSITLSLMLLMVTAISGSSGRRQRTIGFDKPRKGTAFPVEIPENDTDSVLLRIQDNGNRELLFPFASYPDRPNNQEKYVRFSGFDKKGSSMSESMFVTNLTDSEIVSMNVRLRYTALDGRMFHERDVRIDCVIPAGATRKVDFKSWDTQRSFRYHRSLDSKSSATPFTVSIRLLTLTFRR